MVLIVLLPMATIRLIKVSAVERNYTDRIWGLNTSQGDLGTNVQAIELSTPEEKVIALPRVSLKDRFIGIVEPRLPYIVFGWLAGVFVFSVWHLGGWTQLQRLKRRLVKSVEPAVFEKARQLAERLGVYRAVEVVESALVQVPTVVGWLRPMILLPASALTGLNAEQLEAIIAHELVHIKRCDYLINILQTVVEILGFYHPAVWWISRRIRIERENCCDDLAVSACGDKLCYATALAAMEEIRSGQGQFALAATGGSLFERIQRVIGKQSEQSSKRSWLPSFISLLFIMSLIISVSFAMSSRTKNIGGNSVERTANSVQKKSEFTATEDTENAEVKKIQDINVTGKLEFRIAPKEDGLTKETVQEYVKALAEKGPGKVKDNFVWFEAKDGLKAVNLITGKYQERVYVLLRNKEPYIMLPRGWGLERVYPTTDQMGKPAVGFDFDENGRQTFLQSDESQYRQTDCNCCRWQSFVSAAHKFCHE